MASTRPAARVLFLYPTRATSTEGFRDYVSWAPESDAGLLTGTADFDLQDMFTAPDDPRSGRKYGGDPRLFALGLWRKRLFSATADQFFPFLQYAYGPICLLPVLVESIIVVDEIHSFDRSMFASLKRFLKEYPTVPVLCMTATIPGNRRDDLVNDCGLKAYPETTPADLQAIAQHPRYRVEWIERDKAMGIVRHAVEDRRRLLWVVNRVADCQSVFADVERLTRRDSSFCYHSRFRLMDRAKRHRELIHAFQDAGTGSISRPIVGVATQVCEMSLDIDADILITELAPISSLIQRMGRAARKWPLPKERVGRVYVIRPEAGREKPYEPRELKAATEFVERLVGDDLKSQHDLQAAYEACDPEQVEPDKLCPFLDSGPFAEAGSETFRDIEEFTTPCVLDEDLPAVLSALKDRQPYEGFIVPVPKKLVRDSARPGDSRFPRWLSVACASHYLTSTGFADEPQREEVKGDPT
jgi:CRISPR-associated endonuclease/helicase Cas3